MGCMKNKITRLIWCGDQEVSKQLGACRTSNPPVGVALVRRQCPCAVGHASAARLQAPSWCCALTMPV
jgi:hypothetical protein